MLPSAHVCLYMEKRAMALSGASRPFHQFISVRLEEAVVAIFKAYFYVENFSNFFSKII